MQYCFVIFLLLIAWAALVTILQFGILLNTLKVNIKTIILNFRRENFSLLRAWLAWILWEASMEDKGDSKCWRFSRTLSWKFKNHSCPLKVREVGRDILGLTASF